jgi:hypothetical protein
MVHVAFSTHFTVKIPCMQASFWQCIHLANTAAFQRNWWRYFIARPKGSFEPGDLAYVPGNIMECFKELVEDKGYQLVPGEEGRFEHKGRYCLVLRQLRGDQYLVCYLTTFGGAKNYQEIANPVGRYFSLPIGLQDGWPRIPSLRTWPPWEPEAFVLGIPVARAGLQRTNLPVRFRLFRSELERAKQLIRDRLEVSSSCPESVNSLILDAFFCVGIRS